jgi:hypothetical protein
MAEQALHRCMLKILEDAHQIDHISPGLYKFKVGGIQFLCLRMQLACQLKKIFQIESGSGGKEQKTGNLLQKALQSPMTLHE